MAISSIQARRVRAIVRRFEAGDYDYPAMAGVPVDEEATVQALLDGLASPEWRAVMACTEALGRSRTACERVVPVLVAQLAHELPYVRARAAEALGQLGGLADAAIAPLVALLTAEREAFVIQEALRACAKIAAHGERVVPRLVRTLVAASRTPSAAHAWPAAWRLDDDLSPLPIHRGEFRDDFELMREVVQAIAAFPSQADASLPALREALGIRTHGLKPLVVAAIGRLGGLDATTLERVIALLAAPDAEMSEAPAILEALEPYTAHHARLIGALLKVPGLPSMRHDDPMPGVRRFLGGEGPDPDVLALLVEGLSDLRDFVRARCARLLGACGASEPPIAARLAERLADAPEVAVAAAEALGAFGQLAAPSLAALAYFESQCEDEATRAIARESLRRVGAPAALPEGAFDAAGRLIAYLPFDGRPGARVVVHQGRLYVACHRVLAEGDREVWETDEDTFAVLQIDPSSQGLRRYTLPLRFPIQSTGAAGATRDFRLEFELDGKLLCSLRSPFADARGWGNDTFMYLFDPSALRWSRLVAEPPSSRPLERPLVPGAENAANGFSYGELILWKDAHGLLNVDVDETPYHLDDWEFAPGTAEALESAREAALARAQWGVESTGSDVWTLRSPGGEALKVYDVQALLTRLDGGQAPACGRLRAAAEMEVDGRRVLAVVVARATGGAVLLLELAPGAAAMR